MVKRDYNRHTSQTNKAVKRISAFYFGNIQPAKERKNRMQRVQLQDRFKD